MVGALGCGSAAEEDAPPSFVPVAVVSEQAGTTTALDEAVAAADEVAVASAMIEIVIGAATVRVPEGVDGSTLATVLGAVRGLS